AGKVVGKPSYLTPEQVFHRPADRFAGAFMGEASFLPIDHGEAGLRTVLGPLEAEAPDQLTAVRTMAMVRPDDLDFVPDPDGDAIVRSGEYRGSGWLLAVEMDAGSTVLVATSHLRATEPGTRGRVTLVPGHRQVPVADPDPTTREQ
ncbi:MAG: TOBE domain-containing protein, partial [Actinomycetota bacterium]